MWDVSCCTQLLQYSSWQAQKSVQRVQMLCFSKRTLAVQLLNRFKMDTSEEPQKKVFKARKTMKASDRQQLDAVHKAKEELLKPTELKLLNGNHENGDIDIIAETDFVNDRKELNGMIDVKSESHEVSIVKLSDIKEGIMKLDQTKDLKLNIELHSTESPVCQDNETNMLACEDKVPVASDNCAEQHEENSTDVAQEETPSLQSLDKTTTNIELSEKLSEVNNSGEEESHIVLDGIHELEDDIPEEEVKGDVNGRALAEENMDVEHEEQEKILQKEEEEESNDLKDSTDEQGVESDVAEGTKELSKEELQETTENVNHQEMKPEGETENAANIPEGTNALVHGQQEEGAIQDMDIGQEGGCSEENLESLETPIDDSQPAEEAISSSMEIDQSMKVEEQKCSVVQESALEKSVLEIQTGARLESPDTMETDEIIPILEKLAPVEDEPVDFVNTDLNSESVADTEEEKTGNEETSPSKQDSSETLPSETFLVLSDEEEPSDERSSPAVEKTSAPQDADVDIAEVSAEKKEEQKDEEQKEESVKEPQAEKSEVSPGEVSRRKRSKSEDLDSESSKRRRYEGEEYEAELQVKITAGDDLNKKLQNVIQKMLEEKLSTLQCVVFEKTIADLKSRVEKIECKKHENILYAIQAKIARLTKRFGAAKEDLKKRPEQSATVLPASPGKGANEASTGNNSVNYRSGSTVRQMLESKRNVGETVTTFQPSTTGQPSTPTTSSLQHRTPNTTTQVSVSHSTANTSLQARAPPDWKLIQQRLNASSIGTPQNTINNQNKPSPPVTSAPLMTSVIPATTTTTVVGNNQVSGSNSQPMSVSLQSLPVILHVPVSMQSQSQLMQGTTGTLVTNKQSGNVEFIPVQNQSSISNLTKATPVSLAPNKTVNSLSMPSPSIQRNTLANSLSSTLTVQSIPTTHSAAQSSRPSLPSTASSGIYNQVNNRITSQMKSPLSGFNSSSAAEATSSTREVQVNRTSSAESVQSKRVAESSAVSGKPGGVIDLTLDEEDIEITSQDSRRTSTSGLAVNVQSQMISRPSQPPQPNTLQSPSTSASLSSQATIHVLPTAQTTVNITQRPGTQTARTSAPRTPNNPQMVYAPSNLTAAPVQTPIRNTVMQNQNLRQITPQAGGVPVRMQQTAAYVVNNGMTMGSAGPQLTVHHRPPQETVRPIHPAPLPEAPPPQRLPPEAAGTSPPQKPHLKLARVQSQNGIVLSWSVLEVDRSCAIVDSYHLYAYHEDPNATSPSQWKKIGEVKALPLPMACTLTQFVSGSKYYFAVRAKDIYGRYGQFCDPQSTDVISTQSS
ncbi:activating transcription factor 7-interacting protein 1 isoform X2 [Xenopus laevis]|uniref:Activating transcription factor 7-interacting protein 1 isoform X2 n=2 Tax=Xenopus laevis TaxID=8355 RepID=A0A8J0V7G1_XENLA|nr:activating transcription factor 7-interacting protein 1 isoform X2 [Xenopus laevis]